jgi:hypothetical protein
MAVIPANAEIQCSSAMLIVFKDWIPDRAADSLRYNLLVLFADQR